MSQCFTQVNRDAAWCACLCKRKPEARLVQRFHLLYAGSSDLPTRQSGALSFTCIPAASRPTRARQVVWARSVGRRRLSLSSPRSRSIVAAASSSGGPRAASAARRRPVGRRAAAKPSASVSRPSATPKSSQEEAALEAREKAHALAADAERQARDRRQEIAGLEQALADKTRALADRLASTDRLEQDLRAREKRSPAHEQRAAAAAAARAEQLLAERQRELQRVAGLSADEARELLLKQIEGDARRDAANLVKRLETEARETAGRRAQQIITDAIQRSAAEHAIETTVSVVDLPSDDLKGRIIGREGRNIRALETATGVELIVDDTPGAIILSSFDPFRREVARQAIERLIADGRIHPARIEEVVEKVKTEMEETVRKEGEAAAFELGLFDLHPEVLRLMGRLKFRTSYGQNVLNHSKRSRVPRRHHGEGARPERPRRRARRVPPRHRQGDRSRPAGHAPRARPRLPAQARRERAGAAWPSPRTTWTSTGRRSKR